MSSYPRGTPSRPVSPVGKRPIQIVDGKVSDAPLVPNTECKALVVWVPPPAPIMGARPRSRPPLRIKTELPDIEECGLGCLAEVQLPVTPPPATPTPILRKEFTRFTNRSRDCIWWVYRPISGRRGKTSVSITDGLHEHIVGVYDVGKTHGALGHLKDCAKRNDLPFWVHNNCCSELAEDSAHCCFPRTESKQEADSVYSVDSEVAQFHVNKKSYCASKEGIVLDAKTKKPVPRAEAADVAVKVDLECLIARGKERRQEAVALEREKAQLLDQILRRDLNGLEAHRQADSEQVPERKTREEKDPPLAPDPAEPPEAAALPPVDPVAAEPEVRPPDPQVEEVLVAPAAPSLPICAICRAGIRPDEADPRLQATTLHPCGHVFHARCIGRAMYFNRACPLCRAAIQHTVPNVDPVPPDDDNGSSGNTSTEHGDPPNPHLAALQQFRRFPYQPTFWVSPHTVERARRHGLLVIPGSADHPHPIIKVAKEVLVKRIDSLTNGRAYMIGSSPQRYITAGYQHHHATAYSKPTDRSYRGPLACGCMIERCNHLDNRIPCTVMRPEIPLTDLHKAAELALSDIFYVADLEITGARGMVGLPDMTADELEPLHRRQTPEAIWKVNGEGLVTLSFTRDPHKYAYPLPEYQHRNHVHIPGTDVNYAVSKDYSVDGFSLYKFTRVEGPVEAEVPRLLGPSLADLTYIGPVQWKPASDTKLPSQIPNDFGATFSFGETIIADFNSGFGANTAYVPKSALNEAMTSIVHLERNRLTTGGMRIKCIDALKPLHMDNADKLAALIVMIPMGLSLTAHQELSAWNTYVVPRMPVMDQLTQVLNFQRPSLRLLLTSPVSNKWFESSRRTAARVGDFISRHQSIAAVILACSTLLIATGLVMAVGPGEVLPRQVSIRDELTGWLTGASEKVLNYGTDLYARTYPECTSVLLRRLGQAPPCYVEDSNGKATLVETWRYAFYFAMFAKTSSLWVTLGMVAVEEGVKRYTYKGFPMGLLMFLALESTKKFYMYGVGAFLPAVVVGVFHCIWANIDPSSAILFHLMWNLTVWTALMPTVMYANILQFVSLYELALTSILMTSAVIIVKYLSHRQTHPLVVGYANFQRGYEWFGKGQIGLIFAPAFTAAEVESPIDAGATISPATLPKDRSHQAAFQQMGPIVADCLPNVPASSSANLYRAVRTRHLLPKLPLAYNKATLRFLFHVVASSLPHPTGTTKRFRQDEKLLHLYTLEQWLDHYNPNQRHLLEHGRDRLHQTRFRPIWARAHRVFPKREKLLKQGKDFAPRLVLTVTPQFSVVVGPYLYSLSKWLGCNWNKDMPIMYCPGASREDISAHAEWHYDNGYVMYSIDESKCDASYHTVILLLTAAFYRHFCCCPEQIYTCICLAYQYCLIYGSDGLKAFVRGTLVTGSNETTIGNTTKLTQVIAATFFVFARYNPRLTQELRNMHKPDLSPERRPYGLLQAGDDTCLFVRKDLVEAGYDPRSIGDFGFRPEIVTAQPHQLEFLSCCFWPTDHGWMLGPKPGRQIPKLGVDIQFDKLPAAKLRGVCLGMHAFANHVPVLGALVRRILTLTAGVAAKAHWDEWKPTALRTYRANAETYRFAALRYDLDATDILAAEHRISELELNDVICDPVVTRMIAVDVA